MGVILSYFDQLTKAMEELAKDRRVVFIGQGVGHQGTSMSQTLDRIDMSQRKEFPVAEDTQAGFCIGAALEGFIPVCIFPRWNFAICAGNQIVNHLDRIPLYSRYKPKVIIRTAVPSKHPFNPGPQHDADFTVAFRSMLRTVKIVCLAEPRNIVPAYRKALMRQQSTILVEYTDAYRNERGKVAA